MEAARLPTEPEAAEAPPGLMPEGRGWDDDEDTETIL